VRDGDEVGFLDHHPLAFGPAVRDVGKKTTDQEGGCLNRLELPLFPFILFYFKFLIFIFL